MKTCVPDISNIIFIGNARCFHTMDWYRNAQVLLAPQKVLFATDLIESEGHTKLVCEADCIINLFNIDRLLPSRQSHLGDIWRNFVKTVMVPLQIWCTWKIAHEYSKHKNLMFHAHTMYYMWLCWLAGVKYIGTPQGSEILVRPKSSRVYKFFAKKSLVAASHITVDSNNMAIEIKRICGKNALLIQNGIDVTAITSCSKSNATRDGIVSIRILSSNYRIEKIFEGRTLAELDIPITFVYPQLDENYKRNCFCQLQKTDCDLGRLPRNKLYELLVKTMLVVSIPKSDSSPRSVYEAIFCGCCVAITYNPWVEVIPGCMKARLCFVDLNDHNWLSKAIVHARAIVTTNYEPSEKALEMFDQRRSMKRVIDMCYNGEDYRKIDC